ncbi:hypothetical protein KC318_g2333 [Hortaea werneckii]|uniref:Histidine kinase n=1 Tax=Hortaea werneckii TaxID=91943 RepID=A0A3M7AML0_HORWE|nr:hypothetical protein KC334_g2724 [Hortaea werneckii]KAI7019058.1 hypothetical protein KC355_g3155 [Hortaea werneckii]KAI7673271.1 hypothetical protein KC318_g2333 [Hortaea werneckii]RMY09549.1 hypothetical protein D0867_08684 [Hortaea werneckii]RMY28762.1 hypothetical protein D0866_09180 [Hortaea werneckii]
MKDQRSEAREGQQARELYQGWRAVNDAYEGEGSQDAYLTPRGKNLFLIAQLAACRLDVQRALITISISTQTHVLEATQTLSPACDLSTAQDHLIFERQLPRGSHDGLCEFRPVENEDTDSVIVSDCQQDARFEGCEFVRKDAGVRFYAAVPILLATGTPVGALVVLDDRPRYDIGKTKIRDLSEYAQCVVRYLNVYRANQSALASGGPLSQSEDDTLSGDGKLEQAEATAPEQVRAGRAKAEQDVEDNFANSVARSKSRDLAETQERTKFLSNFSHELRSPIHGILGSAQFLQDTVSNDYQNSLLQSIVMSSNMLLDTLNLVLEHNQFSVPSILADQTDSLGEQSSHMLSAAQLLTTATDVDLAQVVEDATETIVSGHFFDTVPYIAEAGQPELPFSDSRDNETGMDRGSTQDVKVVLKIDARSNRSVKTQPAAMSRIVMNLVGNALKFTHSGVVEVGLEPRIEAEESHVKVRLRVEDTGTGMSELFRQRYLFKPFQQENQFAPGVGLGMSVLKALVASLGGDIEVTSVPRIGTRVAINLSFEPGATESEGVPQDLTNIADKLKGKHLVLLDVARMRNEHHQSVSNIKRQEAMHSVATDWLGLRVSSSSDLNCPDADFFLYTEPPPADDVVEHHRKASSKRPSNLEKPLIIITTDSKEAHMIHNRHARRLEGSGRIVQVLAQPCGPRKLAKVLNLSLARAEQADRRTRAQNDQPTDSHRPADSKPPSGAEEDRVRHGDIDDAQDSASAKDLSSASGVSSDARNKPNPHASQALRSSDVASGDLKPVGDGDISAVMPGARQTESPFQGPCSSCTQSYQATSAINSAAKNDSYSLHGLLVDDNKINLRLLVNFVCKARYSYEQAGNGQEAVDAMQTTAKDSSAGHASSNRPFDFICMDIGMPMMNGIDATKRIREQERQIGRSRALIIALTAWDDHQTRKEAETAGMDIFMPKPVKFRDLKDVLDRLANEKGGGGVH